MNLKFVQELPSPEKLLSEQPLPDQLKAVKKRRDAEIAAILTGEDRRLILVVGPCSAHNEDPVCEYVSRLSRVQEKVKGSLVLVPRIYTNKPRTTGVGYKGMLHQPDYHKKPDMARGLSAIRHMHIRALSESHLTAADEMLYPDNHPFLADLLSYVAIGARSVENQQHRLTASGLDIPCGMKNPTSGDLRIMLDSIYAGQQGHAFSYHRWEVNTTGNPLTHAVLRGAVDRYGNHIPNYHYEDLIHLAEMFQQRAVKNPALIVDVNHSNSGKKFAQQPRIALEVMQSRHYSETLRRLIKGFMIESYLLEGAQDAEGDQFGKSITDPCLGWEETEKLIYTIAEKL